MDSNRHFARVKWVDFEGDISFSNRLRPIPINWFFYGLACMGRLS